MGKKIALFSVYTLILLGAGFYAGTQNYTTKVVQDEKNRLKQTIKVVEKIVEKPGGERIIYRTTHEKKDETRRKRIEIVKKDKDWLVGVSYGVDGVSGLREVYTLTLDRKILGGAYLGMYGTSNGELGVGVRLSF